MPTTKTWNMLATATFGVGDIVFTKVGVDTYGKSAEGNPAARQIMDEAGTTGWAAGAAIAKGLILLTTLSWGEYLDDDHPFLAKSPAVALTIVGVFLSGGWILNFLTPGAKVGPA